jgi:hypothetical protein
MTKQITTPTQSFLTIEMPYFAITTLLRLPISDQDPECLDRISERPVLLLKTQVHQLNMPNYFTD